MKKYIFLFPILFCFSAQAELEGNYSLTSGPSECPTGSLKIKIDEKNHERILIFGSSHSWTLNQKDDSETKEEVENGCTYIQKYSKTKDSFTSNTTRSECPNKNENGLVNEKISEKGQDLFYEFNFQKTKYKCLYKKAIKS